MREDIHDLLRHFWQWENRINFFYAMILKVEYLATFSPHITINICDLKIPEHKTRHLNDNWESTWRWAFTVFHSEYFTWKTKTSQWTLQAKGEKSSFFSSVYHCENWKDSPSKKTINFYSVSMLFTNCIFMIPCSGLETFYTPEESLSFFKVEEQYHI